MPEPRTDMLPDTENTTSVEIPENKETPTNVAENVQSPIKAQPVVEDKLVAPVPPPPEDKPPKGFVPYQALDEERRKRKELELKMKELESSSPDIDEEVYSDEGKLLRQQISAVRDKLALVENTRQEEKVLTLYPVLRDKWEEFEEFKTDYPTVALDKVAKLFIAERGLNVEPPPRKGLERPTSGPKTVVEETYSADDIDRLMKTDERKFIKLVRSGKINPDNIK